MYAELLRKLPDEVQSKLTACQNQPEDAQTVLEDCTARMAQIKLQNKELVSGAKNFSRSKEDDSVQNYGENPGWMGLSAEYLLPNQPHPVLRGR